MLFSPSSKEAGYLNNRWKFYGIIKIKTGRYVVGSLVFIVVLIILIVLLEKGINKLLGVEKKKVSETSGKKVDQWGRGIILILFLCTLPFFIMEETSFMKWYWIPYLIVLLGFQSILEWKYMKNSKQYVTTLIILIISVIILYNIEYFISLFNWS